MNHHLLQHQFNKKENSMNFILLLNTLKKSGEVLKLILVFAFKYWYVIIIALLLLINTTLRNDIVSLEKDKTKLNNDIVLLVQKHKQDLLEAQKKAQDREIEILTKQKEVEVKYNEQIKNLQSDVVNANSANTRLSDKLSTNTDKLSKLTKDQADSYTKSLSIILSDSATKYREMGERADQHRLAEERCVGLYNALVDGSKETKE